MYNKFLFLSLVFLSSCSAIIGPQPNKSDWPFEKANHVILMIDKNEKLSEDLENKIDIYYDKNAHHYEFYSNQDVLLKGKIWFKQYSEKYVGFAISMPLTNEEIAKLDPKSEDALFSIYLRGRLYKKDASLRAIVEFLPCEPPIKDKNPNCEYKDENSAWLAVEAAKVPDEKDAIIEFDVDLIEK